MQATGIALIAALCAFPQRSIDRRCLRSWSLGWLCLAAALFALLIMFRVRELTPILQPVYFFGEYAFAFLVIAGCREYASGTRLVRGAAGWPAPALLPHTPHPPLRRGLPTSGPTHTSRTPLPSPLS